MIETVELSQLAKIVTGKTPPTIISEYFEGEYPFITPSDIPTFQEKILPNTERSLSEKGKNYQKQLLIPKGSICYVAIGSTIGKLCKTHNNCFTNQQLHSLIPYPDKISGDYLYYLLRTISPYFQLVGDGKGSGKPIINKTEFSKVKIYIAHDIPTQQRIASILSAYDDLIEVNNQRIKLLEETARELYKEWFVRLRFPGYKNAKFVKGVPEGWEIKKVNDTFNVMGGGTPSTEKSEYWNGNVNWFTPTDITSSTGIFLHESGNKITEKGLKESSSKLFPAHSIMMTSRATIGAVGINTTSACTNQGFITCLPNEQIPYTFLYCWIIFNKEIFEMLGTGSTFLEITKGTFKQINMLVPIKNLIQKFHEMVNPMFNQVENLQQQNTELRQIRDRLLPRLISGKLAVKEQEAMVN